MATKHVQMQQFIRYYKEMTGQREIDMKEVAKCAMAKGWEMPQPISPIDRLAREFSMAAREETKYDKITGKPYRVNHVVRNRYGGIQGSFWIDIDEEKDRKKMHKSLMMRRGQMVDDALHASYDADHWNSINPNQEPIIIPLDFTEDVEWRKNGLAGGKRSS